jgi:hypothetical protein
MVIASSFIMPLTQAVALPLHRIGSKWRYAPPKPPAVVTVAKPLSAEQGAAWIASRARVLAAKTKTMGWCFRAVKGALKPFGIVLQGAAAWMAKDQLMSDDRFEAVSFDDLQPGDILVHDKSNNHPYGHIAIYLGNDTEASDHVQQLINGEEYGGTTVFRLNAPINFLATISRPRFHHA